MSEIRGFAERFIKLKLSELASLIESDVVAIYGPMNYGLSELLRDDIENLVKNREHHSTLTIILDTGGGLIEVVERAVKVVRRHYKQVDFIIPDMAMSAGTIFTLSADNIFMDYYSQLGPIDPQFFIDQKWVPAVGYLEKFEELNDKSECGTLTPIEYMLAEKFDFADLHQYEQARELSVELLETWLPKYKFKNWKQRASTGEEVTQKMKQERAKKIAVKLNDTKRWHTHSRGISMTTLQNELKLKIEDMGEVKYSNLYRCVKGIHPLIVDFIKTQETFAYLRSVQFIHPEVFNEEL